MFQRVKSSKENERKKLLARKKKLSFRTKTTVDCLNLKHQEVSGAYENVERLQFVVVELFRHRFAVDSILAAAFRVVDNDTLEHELFVELRVSQHESHDGRLCIADLLAVWIVDELLQMRASQMLRLNAEHETNRIHQV